MICRASNLRKYTLGLAIFLSLIFSIVISYPAYAQVTRATLSGTVTGPSGSIIAGAKVVLNDLGTGVVREVRANDAGFYSLTELPSGNYALQVLAPGFSKVVQTNLSLSVGQEQSLDLSMKFSGEPRIEIGNGPIFIPQGVTPKFEVDPYWPKPLPERWVTGEIGGVCVDSQDHVFVVQRVNDVGGMDGHREGLTDDEYNAGQAAPPVLEFDTEGKVINAWGDSKILPKDLHGCAVDRDGHVWLDGSEDGIVQEYSHDGKEMLLQIGKKGVFDSSDGTVNGTPLNTNPTQFFRVSEIAFDPHNGDMYVADGHAKGKGGNNFRIVVFDRTGHYLRQWKLHRSAEEAATAARPTPHCVRVSNDGVVYVCDRWMNRLQLFDTMGNFKKDMPFSYKVWTPASSSAVAAQRFAALVGSCSSVEFSRDPGEKYMFVINEIDEEVDVADRATGQVLGSFGRPGHQVGEFMHAHTMALDSQGNIYVGESVDGRRVQKFKLVSGK